MSKRRTIVPTFDIIIGAGIAGASIARALARRGRVVRVFDPGGPASGASGVPRAVIQPVTGMRATWRPRQAEARDRAEAWLAESVSRDLWSRRGVVRVALDAKHADLWSDRCRAAPDDVARWLDPHEAHHVAPGLSGATTGAIWLPGGLDVDGAGLVRSLLDAPGITVQRARVVEAHGAGSDGGTHERPSVLLDDGTRVVGASVTIAAGVGATALLGALPVALQPIRGVCGWRDAAMQARVVVGHRGQIVPHGGRTFIGSTFSPNDDEPRVETADTDRLAMRLREALPGLRGPIVDGWSGIRVAAADRAPLVARDVLRPGVFVVAALGSKGFLLAPWIAERLAASLVDGAPLDVPAAWGWR